MLVYISYVAKACLFTAVFSQLSIFTADCLHHPIQMAGVETIWELHTLPVINSYMHYSPWIWVVFYTIFNNSDWKLAWMYIFVHFSPSQECTNLYKFHDNTAVACSNNNQAQLHTQVSVSYWSPDVWLSLELLRDIQFGLAAILNNSLASYDNNYVCHECISMTRSGGGNPKIFGCALCASGLNPFLNF